MSRDKTLKSHSTLVRHRNVLSRAERVERMRELGLWKEGQSPLGLPKIAHRKAAVGGKTKKKAKEGEEGAKEGAAVPVAAAAPAAKPAAKAGGK